MLSDRDRESDPDVYMQASQTNIETFSLKFINLFIKSSNLCTNVEIYLKRGYPLILVYKIGSLGKLQFVLAPNQESEA